MLVELSCVNCQCDDFHKKYCTKQLQKCQTKLGLQYVNNAPVRKVVSQDNESVPIQLAQCCFFWLAISRAKNKYIFPIKYTEAILSNGTRKLLWFEITKMLTVVQKIIFLVSFIIIFGIFGTFSFPITFAVTLRHTMTVSNLNQ